GPDGGEILIEIAMMTGTAASTASPAQLRRRPKISQSSERRKRVDTRRPVRAEKTVAGGGASTADISAADIEALPGPGHQQPFAVGRADGEAPHRHAGVYQRGHHLLRCDAVEQSTRPGWRAADFDEAELGQYTCGIRRPVGLHAGVRLGRGAQLVERCLRD